MNPFISFFFISSILTLFAGMHELPMLHGMIAILYGKPGTVVQASET